MTSEGEIAFGVGEDCKAVRLTEAQIEALRTVGRGGVHRAWTPMKPSHWRVEGFWQPPRAAPFDRVRELGLIKMAGKRDMGMGSREDFEVTPSGRVLLDLLAAQEAAAKEKTP